VLVALPPVQWLALAALAAQTALPPILVAICAPPLLAARGVIVALMAVPPVRLELARQGWRVRLLALPLVRLGQNQQLALAALAAQTALPPILVAICAWFAGTVCSTHADYRRAADRLAAMASLAALYSAPAAD
jgi:hypothetical protein